MDASGAGPDVRAGAGADALAAADSSPLLWVVMVVAIGVWFVLPWAERWQQAMRVKATLPAADPSPAARSAPPAPAPVASGSAQDRHAAAPQRESVVPVLGFDPGEAFRDAFAEACRLVGDLMLSVPAMGEEYTAAMGAIHCLQGILDKLFSSWGSPEEVARVSRLKESGAVFKQNFGDSCFAEHARGLLALSGFSAEASDAQGGLWVFQLEDPHARLRALTVRLCLQKLGERQKVRGTMRFTQSGNAGVLPNPRDAHVLELFDLYRLSTVPSDPPVVSNPRERNTEAEVRIRLNERRAAVGIKVPLTLHEGLASAARMLAHSQRTRERVASKDPHKRETIDVNEEVQRVLAKLPLPPGFDAAHLHWRSDELPRLFGLTTTAGKNSNAGGASTSEDPDTAADILARECAGSWAVRQSSDVGWPSAVMCGVGAALDYTINRGFVVALLVGFDDAPPDEEVAAQQREARLSEARRRRAPVEAPGTDKRTVPGGFGARIHTMDNPNGVAMNAKYGK